MARTIIRKGTHAAMIRRAGRQAVRRGMDCAALLNSMPSADDRADFERGMRAERTSRRRKLLSGLPRGAHAP